MTQPHRAAAPAKLPGRLGIVSALREELDDVLQRLHDAHREPCAGREFFVGHLHGHEVVVTLSRVGKVAAAHTAALLIDRFACGGIVFTGVAGGIGDGVAVGDLVVGDAFLQHDMDATPIFPRYEVPYTGRSRFVADSALSARLVAAAVKVSERSQAIVGAEAAVRFGLHAPQVHRGLILSGDRFVATSGESQALRVALPDALAVEMEGAAFAQVCHDHQIPFAAVRTISDRADDAAHVDFLAFVQAVASRYSAALLEALLQVDPVDIQEQ